MTSLSELWPPFGLVVRSGGLTLTPVTDEDLPGLVDLVRSGVHAPDEMPFGMPWTRRATAEVAPEYARHYWQTRAAFVPADFHLDLVVRDDGELVGVQGFFATDYPVTRTAETGSWLALRHQDRGIGTRMRQSVCSLLVDHLGAAEVTSGAFVDNPASLAVSRKVGYRRTDTKRVAREGALALHAQLRLRPDDLVRGDPVEVSGVEPLRAFLGVDQA
ncbi:MAG: GNAT family N-acetyltransferase [Janthinobacterium lividum]